MERCSKIKFALGSGAVLAGVVRSHKSVVLEVAGDQEVVIVNAEEFGEIQRLLARSYKELDWMDVKRDIASLGERGVIGKL